jgi:hypothetical protein
MQKYKIFRICAEWDQSNFSNNRVSTIYGLKPDNNNKINIENWWSKLKRTKRMQEVRPIKLIELKETFLGEYSWWVRWFCHVTFGRFDSSGEAVKDFKRYLNEELGAIYGDFSNEEIWRIKNKNDEIKYADNSKIYLMGAEQTWRWKVCDCKHCIKNNITVITH